MTAQHLTDLGLKIVAVVAAAWAAWLAFVGMLRTLRRFSRLVDDFIGTEDNAGVLDRLRTIEDQLETLTTNGNGRHQG